MCRSRRCDGPPRGPRPRDAALLRFPARRRTATCRALASAQIRRASARPRAAARRRSSRASPRIAPGCLPLRRRVPCAPRPGVRARSESGDTRRRGDRRPRRASVWSLAAGAAIRAQKIRVRDDADGVRDTSAAHVIRRGSSGLRSRYASPAEEVSLAMPVAHSRRAGSLQRFERPSATISIRTPRKQALQPHPPRAHGGRIAVQPTRTGDREVRVLFAPH